MYFRTPLAEASRSKWFNVSRVIRCLDRSTTSMRFGIGLWTETSDDTLSLSRQSSCNRSGSISSRACRFKIAHACEAVAPVSGMAIKQWKQEEVKRYGNYRLDSTLSLFTWTYVIGSNAKQQRICNSYYNRWNIEEWINHKGSSSIQDKPTNSVRRQTVNSARSFSRSQIAKHRMNNSIRFFWIFLTRSNNEDKIKIPASVCRQSGTTCVKLSIIDTYGNERKLAFHLTRPDEQKSLSKMVRVLCGWNYCIVWKVVSKITPYNKYYIL